MSQFSYSFCLSLFHSLWQSALLLILYAAIHPIVKKQLPSFKRNLLYGLLFSQVIISSCTFLIYYSSSFGFYRDIIEPGVSTFLLAQQSFIEKYSYWIISFYILVISLKTIQLLYNWYRFKRLCNTTLIKPSVDLKLFTVRKAYEFGIGRKVTLWLSDAVSTPLTFGFLKPVILMPVALLNNLSLAEAESLIIHELTHIKNNDYILNWLLVISETIFFFNPFIRIMSNKIKLEREKNCDVQVLQFKYPVINYAETLLKAAKFKTNINFFPLAAVFKNKQLLQRITFFTAHNNLVFSKRRFNTLSFTAIAVTLLVNLFLLVQVKHHAAPAVSENEASQFPAQFTDRLLVASTNEFPKTISVTQQQVSGNLKDQQAVNLQQPVKKPQKVAEIVSVEKLKIPLVSFENFAMPVVNVEQSEEELFVKEECSGTSESVTKTYKLQLKNGQWKNELVLVVKEGRPKLDSICIIKDTVISYIPAMQ